MTEDQRLLEAILSENLYSFVWESFNTLHPGQQFIPAWHVQAMCWKLQQVAEGRCQRLLITVPPRHLKSICTAVAFVAWSLGRDPGQKFLVASYGQELASQHGRQFRTLIETPWYRRLFPKMRAHPKRNTELEVMTTMMGGRKAVSLGGAVTGFGADTLIIDDLMKAADARLESERQRVKEFFEQTLFSRLDDKKNGPIVAIQQRLHEDDFPAYLMDKGNFEHLDLKAIAEEDETHSVNLGNIHRRSRGEALFPEREPLETLARIREDIGSFAFSAQYQQNPVPPEGNLVRWDWFETYEERPPRSALQMVVQSWDTAFTDEPSSDFSVCTTWGYREEKWYLLDLYRARLKYPALKRKIREKRNHWRADRVIVEYAASGIPLVQDFRLEGLGRLVAYKPRVDKETRLAAQTAKLETGNYLIPETADWLPAFKNELLAFPNGRYDDQVDSMSQFLDWIGSRRGRRARDTTLYGERYPGPRLQIGVRP